MPGTIGFGMRAPVINNRRNAWYQKRNAVGIPRRAHTKKYLDAYYTGQAGGLQPPTGYAYALFNERGHSGTVRYGYVGDYTGVGETPYGAVSPNVVRDLFWARLAAQAPATSNVAMRFGPAGASQITGVTNIVLSIQGFGNITLTWNGTQTRYAATNTPLWDFLSNPVNVGKIIGINGLPAETVEVDWASFDDEAELAPVVQHFVTHHGVVLPVAWDDMTFAEKIAWLMENVEL